MMSPVSQFRSVIMTFNAAVIKAGAVLLRIQTFAEPCLAINFVATGIMRGEGDTKWPFLIAVIGM